MPPFAETRMIPLCRTPNSSPWFPQLSPKGLSAWHTVTGGPPVIGIVLSVRSVPDQNAID